MTEASWPRAQSWGGKGHKVMTAVRLKPWTSQSSEPIRTSPHFSDVNCFKFHSTESENALTPISSSRQKDVESPWKIEFIILIVLGIILLVFSTIVVVLKKIIQDKENGQSK